MRALVLLLLLFLLGEVNAADSASERRWTMHPGYRSAAVTIPSAGHTGFTLMPQARTGITFTNLLSQERSLTNQIYLNGSGVALGDVDGDGWCDIYFCGLEHGNALYRNLGGWRFEDITAQAGVACADQASTGAVLADIDGDGDLDLLVNSIGHGVRLFLNNGHGRFTEVTDSAGLASRAGGTSLALADIDGDGQLDLYVANYRSHTLRDEPDTRFRVSTLNGQFNLLAVNGRSVTNADLVGRFTVDPSRGVLENGEADVLYRNLGHGRFAPLSWTDGTFRDENGQPVGIPYDWGLSVMFRDLNEDGAPDLYVCNDFHSPDRIWINDGHGRFRAVDPLAFRHTSLFSMGVDFADVDRDGHDDVLVADMLSRSHARRLVQVADRKMLPPPIGSFLDRPQYSRNMLFWNRGDGTYSETAQLSGVEAADWCWCPVFLDVDLDGYEDLLMVTGHERDAQNIDLSRQIERSLQQHPRPGLAQLELRKIFPVYDTPNFAFRNHGDLTFEEVGHAWGFDSTAVSQGIALADLDNDGDLDVVINCLNSGPLLYRNDTTAPRIAVRLRGASPNTQGIGAKVRVLGGAVATQSQEIISGGRYLSGDDPIRTFAAGSVTNQARIEVTWRSGRRSVVTNASANEIYEIEEIATLPASPREPKAAVQAPLFQDVTLLLSHRHFETPYDDFQDQPLLPRRLSQGGPGLTWCDLNGDGWEDLVIGSGRGGTMGGFLNDGHGSFVPARQPAFALPVTRDQTTILAWRPAAGKIELLAGSANYEDGLTNGPAVRAFDLVEPTVDDRFPGQESSTGPLALTWLPGTGSWELFVGGQALHGRYPEPASSLLLRSQGADFQVAPDSDTFRDLGLINGAIWSDLNGDGVPELILACEWGPVRVFQRTATGFSEITRSLGLDHYHGWWQSVAVGDFDGDGKPDMVAGNWGRNTKYQSYLAHPLEIYAGDPDGDGRVEIIEAYFAPDLNKVVPWRDWETLGRSLPFLLDRYHSFSEFSTASVAEILGPQQASFRHWSANTLDSMLFLNRGDHFEAHPLPLEAQLAPVFGIAVADFDGDGNDDLFLSQNFFAGTPLTSRYDAGRGALLRGNGKGGFQSVPGQASGLLVYGEGRGAAVCDYDHDGRPDLAVGQNANATKLFHNVSGRPGLRVHLKGPPSNPDGIGAALRVLYADGRAGPTREIHAGGGHWSQDAPVTVLGLSGTPAAVRVTWPGGRLTEYRISPGSMELEASWSGPGR